MRADFAGRLTLTQVAQQLGVHVATTWRWALYGVKGRRLRTVAVGGRRFVLPADLEAFLAQDGGQRHDADADLHRRAADAGKLLDARGVRIPTAIPYAESRLEQNT